MSSAVGSRAGREVTPSEGSELDFHPQVLGSGERSEESWGVAVGRLAGGSSLPWIGGPSLVGGPCVGRGSALSSAVIPCSPLTESLSAIEESTVLVSLH